MIFNISITQSLNGVYTSNQYQPIKLSSPSHFKWIHQMRNIHDAILVSGNTIKNDDPNLTSRLNDAQKIHNPTTNLNYCIVIDKYFLTDKKNKIFQNNLEKIILYNSNFSNKKIVNAEIIDYAKYQDENGNIQLKNLKKLLPKNIKKIWAELGWNFINKINNISNLYLSIVPVFVKGISNNEYMDYTNYINETIEIPGTNEKILHIKYNNDIIPTNLKTKYGNFLTFKMGNIIVLYKNGNNKKCYIRIHSQCHTSEIFFSKHCKCKLQLKNSMKLIGRMERGIIIYLPQEGRGIGFNNKLQCYNTQEKQINTYDANLMNNFPIDAREYSMCDKIIEILNIKKEECILLSSNKQKINEIKIKEVMTI